MPKVLTGSRAGAGMKPPWREYGARKHCGNLLGQFQWQLSQCQGHWKAFWLLTPDKQEHGVAILVVMILFVQNPWVRNIWYFCVFLTAISLSSSHHSCRITRQFHPWFHIIKALLLLDLNQSPWISIHVHHFARGFEDSGGNLVSWQCCIGLGFKDFPILRWLFLWRRRFLTFLHPFFGS